MCPDIQTKYDEDEEGYHYHTMYYYQLQYKILRHDQTQPVDRGAEPEMPQFIRIRLSPTSHLRFK